VEPFRTGKRRSYALVPNEHVRHTLRALELISWGRPSHQRGGGASRAHAVPSRPELLIERAEDTSGSY
jgi:hypothetical protein